MGTKLTVLQHKRHSEFLAAQRYDPITREVFKANDRVTLCAACLLPFLEESWGGMGGTHCGQSSTVGLETFGMVMMVPASENRGPYPINADSATGRWPEAEVSNTTLSLRPVPDKLHEVPIRLRG